MAANKRTKAEREKDLLVLADRRLRGETLEAIGRDMGVSTVQAWKDWQTVLKRWREKEVRDADDLVRIELQKLDRLEMAYWEGWLRSLRDRERTITAKDTTAGTERVKTMGAGVPGAAAAAAERTTVSPGEQSRAQIVREARDGSPAFLDGVRSCMERRAKLLGLDKPVTDLYERVRDEARLLGLDEHLAISRAEAIIREHARAGPA